MIDTDGTNLQQISFDKAFDSFPMFSPDGKKLVFVRTETTAEEEQPICLL